MTLICPNEGKKMTPDHVCKNVYFHPAFLQPEGCSYVISSVLGFGARSTHQTILPRPTEREKAPISPTYPTMGENPRIHNLDRSSHLGKIFPRSQQPPSSEASPKMTISSPYRTSTVFHSTLGPLLLTSHCHCTVCRCRPRRRCVHRSC